MVIALFAAASAAWAADEQQQQQTQGGQNAQKPTAQPSKTEEERIRAEGAAGGTRPVPAEKRKAVGAGAGPHKHDNSPSPAKLPKDEPVEPAK
jgi:hypothetical protein